MFFSAGATDSNRTQEYYENDNRTSHHFLSEELTTIHWLVVDGLVVRK